MPTTGHCSSLWLSKSFRTEQVTHLQSVPSSAGRHHSPGINNSSSLCHSLLRLPLLVSWSKHRQAFLRCLKLSDSVQHLLKPVQIQIQV